MHKPIILGLVLRRSESFYSFTFVMSPVPKSIKLNNGNSMPTLGLGVYLLPLAECAEIVNNALEVGYRHLDSARLYGNERETAEGIARFLKSNSSVKRQDIFYTTKIWPSDFGYEATTRALQQSFDEIKNDIGYIDLVLLHHPTAPPQKRLEAYQALQDAYRKGLVKNIGVSNYGVHHLEELYSQPWLTIEPAVNQIELNPWCQQADIVDFCRKHNIIVQAYSPLMFGHRLDDPELVALAQKYSKTTAQILIRWNLQNGFVPLPKTVRTSRLKENFDVYDFELSQDEMKFLGSPTGKYLPNGDDPTAGP